MANTVPFYRIRLNDRLRKFLGINLLNKKIYVFKVKGKTYLSTDTIPKSGICEQLSVKLGSDHWYVNIPTTYLDYEPNNIRLLNTHGRVLELTKSE